MLGRVSCAFVGALWVTFTVPACSAAPDAPDPPAAGEPIVAAPAPVVDAPLKAPAGPEEPKGPPAVAFVGRFDTSDPKGPVAGWPGTRIVARFEGTGVSVKLDELVPDAESGPSEWDVSIDGKLGQKLVLAEGEHDYVLASGLTAGPHVVELYKRSEAQNGVTKFLGYDFDGGKLLAPPVRPARRIEVIGDSQPAAFGIEGAGQGPDCPGADWAAKYQNFHRSFAARLGDRFSADLHGTVFSGKGIVKNIWRPDTETMPRLYARSNPIDGASRWDARTFSPDVIVVMIGGNDFSEGQPRDDGAPSRSEFTAAYGTFIRDVRAAHGQAHILLAVSPSVSDAEPAGRQSRTNIQAAITAAVSERTGAGDARVYAAELRIADPATELTGCDGHGNEAFHARVADELAAVVRQKTGW